MLLEMDFCNALVLLYRDLRIFTKMFASVPEKRRASCSHVSSCFMSMSFKFKGKK